MSKIKRICFYGGPGSGKSTIALDVTQKLKKQKHLVEYISEVIKSIAYQQTNVDLWHQFDIFSKQIKFEIDFLKTNIPTIITDAPPLQCCTYIPESEICKEACENISLILEKQYQSLNFFIKRKYEYDCNGRWGDLELAKKKDEEILFLLNEKKINYFEITSDNTDCVIEKFLENI